LRIPNLKNGAVRTCEDKILGPPREALRNPEFVETERRSRPAERAAKAPHHPITSAVLKFVLLDASAKAAACSAVWKRD
jgi:hypothetical protein